MKEDNTPRKIFYVFAAAGYLVLLSILLVVYDLRNLTAVYIMGAVISLLLDGILPPEPLSFSLYSELIFFLISPGTWVGIMVGLWAVSTWRQLYRALIPPGILLLILCINPWFLFLGTPMIFATAIPHSLIGAFIGWKSRQLGSRLERNQTTRIFIDQIWMSFWTRIRFFIQKSTP